MGCRDSYPDKSVEGTHPRQLKKIGTIPHLHPPPSPDLECKQSQPKPKAPLASTWRCDFVRQVQRSQNANRKRSGTRNNLATAPVHSHRYSLTRDQLGLTGNAGGREFENSSVAINDLPTYIVSTDSRCLISSSESRKIVRERTAQVRQLPRSKRSLLTIFCLRPTAAHRVELQCLRPIEPILFRIQTRPRWSCSYKPIQRKVRVVARGRRVRLVPAPTGTPISSILRMVACVELAAPPYRSTKYSPWNACGLHAMPPPRAFNVRYSISNRLAVIEEPVQAVKTESPDSFS